MAQEGQNSPSSKLYEQGTPNSATNQADFKVSRAVYGDQKHFYDRATPVRLTVSGRHLTQHLVGRKIQQLEHESDPISDSNRFHCSLESRC
jgi:hypothetical protein